MAPKRSFVREDQIEVLKAEVRSEEGLWCRTDPNYGKEYYTKKAWERIANILGCTTPAVQKKWQEIVNEKKMKQREAPHLYSGSAAVKDDEVYNDFDDLGWLNDQRHVTDFENQHSPSGNLDTLMSASPLPPKPIIKQQPDIQNVMKAATLVNFNQHEQMPSKLVMNEENFWSSVVQFTSLLNDEDKLDLRIEITETVEHFYDLSTARYVPDDEEIKVMGVFIRE